jgi:hypothetical protein
MDWIVIAQVMDRWHDLVDAVINLRVSQNTGNFFFTRLGFFSFSGRTLLRGIN